MTPKPGSPNTLPGLPNFAVFVRLKISQLNFKEYRSLNVVVFETERSRFLKSGPTRAPGPRLPTVPKVAGTTASVLNQRSIVGLSSLRLPVGLSREPAPQKQFSESS